MSVFHRKRLQGRLQTFAGKVASISVGGYSALQGRMQCTAGAVAVHCRDGCSALQGRLQCTASETGKRGTEIASPILDKRKGWRDTPHAGHCSPQEISAELIFPLSHPLSLIYLVSQIHDGCGVGRRERIPSAKDEAASAGGQPRLFIPLKVRSFILKYGLKRLLYKKPHIIGI